jgi:hypothetical protein
MTIYTIWDSECGLVLATNVKGKAIRIAAIQACKCDATPEEIESQMLIIRVALLQAKKNNCTITYIVGADSKIDIEIWA